MIGRLESWTLQFLEKRAMKPPPLLSSMFSESRERTVVFSICPDAGASLRSRIISA